MRAAALTSGSARAGLNAHWAMHRGICDPNWSRLWLLILARLD